MTDRQPNRQTDRISTYRLDPRKGSSKNCFETSEQNRTTWNHVEVVTSSRSWRMQYRRRGRQGKRGTQGWQLKVLKKVLKTGLTGLAGLTDTRLLKSFKKTFKTETISRLITGPNPRDASASKNWIHPTHQVMLRKRIPWRQFNSSVEPSMLNNGLLFAPQDAL